MHAEGFCPIAQTRSRRPDYGTTDGRSCYREVSYTEGPSTQYLRSLVPNTIKSMVFGTRKLKYWVLGPSGTWFGPRAHFLRPCTLECDRGWMKGPLIIGSLTPGLVSSLRPVSSRRSWANSSTGCAQALGRTWRPLGRRNYCMGLYHYEYQRVIMLL